MTWPIQCSSWFRLHPFNAPPTKTSQTDGILNTNVCICRIICLCRIIRSRCSADLPESHFKAPRGIDFVMKQDVCSVIPHIIIWGRRAWTTLSLRRSQILKSTWLKLSWLQPQNWCCSKSLMSHWYWSGAFRQRTSLRRCRMLCCSTCWCFINKSWMCAH